MKIPYERTTCACSKCVRCCKVQPGPLVPGDLERIAEFRGETLDDAKKNFWASPGALVKDMFGTVARVGTITPRYDRRKKRCVFLDAADRCTIHPVAPAGCAIFDTHQALGEAHERSVWVIRQQQTPEYQALRNELPYATTHKPTSYI